MNKDTLNGILKYNRGAEKEIVRLREENNELQEKIDKAIKYITSNEWAKDYELSSCRTRLLNILYNNKKNTLPQHSQQLNPIISKLYVNNELQYDLTPKEDKKIDKLEIYDDSINWCCNGKAINDTEKDIIDKINEIIDRLNGEK